MTKKTILICDDDINDAQRWSGQVNRQCRPKDFEAKPVPPEKFFEALSALEKRRQMARENKREPQSAKRNLFDNADIVVVDYDLLKLDSYVTGEDVAYLCRCYSRCGLIVGLNRYGENYFDLTLKGHPESYADLNIGSEQLANPGLWKETWNGKQIRFRPWYWPLLPAAYEAFVRRVRHLSKHGQLDKEVLSYLGFDNEVIAALPRSTREFLAPGKSPEKTTFRAFVSKSGNGLRLKDKAADSESTARIAAARLWKWLERLVLPGQDILVDAPHLVARYPSLLKGDLKTTEPWNKTASFARGSGEMSIPKIKNVRFSQLDWVSRPAWFWKKLVNPEQIKEIADPYSKEKSDFVFCEDISRFTNRTAAREFVADVPSSFVRRFVLDRDSQEGKKATEGVDYTPAVRFSL